MKRHIITAMCALTAFNATHAQHDYEQGNVAVEVQVNPFTTDFNTFRLGKDSGRDQFKLKGKYFINDKHAIRIGIGFSTNSKSHDLGDGFTTESNYIDSEYPNTTPSTEDAHQSTLSKEGTKKNKNGHFSVDLGYEYHFLKEDRVNLYAGAQIGLFKDYVSETYDYTETYKGWYNNNTSYNSWMSYTLIDNTKEEYKNHNSNGDVSCTGLSFNLFTGINYFINDNIYVGAELGLSMYSSKACDSSKKEVISDDRWNSSDKRVYNRTTTTTTDYKGKTDVKSFTASFYVEPALRLGWVF